MSALRNTAESSAASTFLTILWGGALASQEGDLDERFEAELRPLRRTAEGTRPAAAYLAFRNIGQLIAAAMGRDDRGEDIYVGVHLRRHGVGKGGNDSVALLVACFADVDVIKHGLDRDRVLAVAMAAPFGPPTLAVWSGGGWHFYWVYDEPLDAAHVDSAQHRDLATRLRAWMNRVLGVPAADEMSTADRILRLPGTHNWKPAYRVDATVPPEVELVVAEPGRRYPAEALADGIPGLPPAAGPTKAEQPSQDRGGRAAPVGPAFETGGLSGLKACVVAAGGLPWLAERLGIRTHGQSAHCPNGAAHNHGDRRPSLSLHPGSWRCHACGIGGDAFDLWLAVRPGTLKSAIEGVAGLVGMRLPTTPSDGDGPAGRPRHQAGVRRDTRPVPRPGRQGLQLLREIWNLVSVIDPTRDLQAYLGLRGLDDWAPADLGVRDWRPRSAEIIALLRQHSPAAKIEAGLCANVRETTTPGSLV